MLSRPAVGAAFALAVTVLAPSPARATRFDPLVVPLSGTTFFKAEPQRAMICSPGRTSLILDRQSGSLTWVNALGIPSRTLPGGAANRWRNQRIFTQELLQAMPRATLDHHGKPGGR